MESITTRPSSYLAAAMLTASALATDVGDSGGGCVVVEAGEGGRGVVVLVVVVVATIDVRQGEDANLDGVLPAVGVEQGALSGGEGSSLSPPLLVGVEACNIYKEQQCNTKVTEC